MSRAPATKREPFRTETEPASKIHACGCTTPGPDQVTAFTHRYYAEERCPEGAALEAAHKAAGATEAAFVQAHHGRVRGDATFRAMHEATAAALMAMRAHLGGEQ